MNVGRAGAELFARPAVKGDGDRNTVKELRAVVLGIFVVVLVMIGISLWRRPSRELKHLRGFKVAHRSVPWAGGRKLAVTIPLEKAK